MSHRLWRKSYICTITVCHSAETDLECRELDDTSYHILAGLDGLNIERGKESAEHVNKEKCSERCSDPAIANVHGRGWRPL